MTDGTMSEENKKLLNQMMVCVVLEAKEDVDKWSGIH